MKLLTATAVSLFLLLFLLASALPRAEEASISSGSHARPAVSNPAVSNDPQKIIITRKGSQPSGKGPAEYFTGAVRIDPLFKANDPARAAGASVAFEPALGRLIIAVSLPYCKSRYCMDS